MPTRVAVIAVHGVADQLPFNTARATADLLTSTLRDEISEFQHEEIRLDVQPLRPSRNTTRTPQAWHWWQQSVTLPCDTRPTSATESHPDIPKMSSDASTEYFQAQIQTYRQRPDDTVYDTVRLSAKIEADKREIDVYEMYWADLSRVPNNLLQAIEELYHVLFTACNIGSMELSRCKVLYPERTKSAACWWLLSRSEKAAERILTLFVPLANVCLALLLVFALPHLLPTSVKAEQMPFLTLLGAMIGSLVITAGFVFGFPSRPMRRHWWLGLGIVAGGILGFGMSYLEVTCIRVILSGVLWCGCFPLIAFVAAKHNLRQPGAFLVGAFLWVLILFAVLYEAMARCRDNEYWALDTGLAAAEWALCGLALLWGSYLLAALLSSFLGWALVLFEWKVPARRLAIRRVVWTANLAILVPGMLSIILNLGLWEAAAIAGTPFVTSLFPSECKHKPICVGEGTWISVVLCMKKPLQAMDRLDRSTSGDQSGDTSLESVNEAAPRDSTFTIAANRMPNLLVRKSAQSLIVVVAPLFMMVLVTGWLLLPAILADATGSSESEDAERCRQLGNDLSKAWRYLWWGAELFVRGALFLLVVASIALSWNLAQTIWLQELFYRLSGIALLAVGLLFMALVTGALQYAGLRTVVDVAADVANWLRMHPIDNNPTSRISARYVSLLRYIENRKDENGEPYYGRVVILAHSLGSVITADLLRYLKRYLMKHKDSSLVRIEHGSLPIYLFTQGCPLRQLLALRLPITYGWAWHASQGWNDNNRPAPSELLGVKVWINAYCSGDYVGRYLWHDDQADIPWQREEYKIAYEGVSRREVCVGAGAHIQYWDPQPVGSGEVTPQRPSGQIGDQLERLISADQLP